MYFSKFEEGKLGKAVKDCLDHLSSHETGLIPAVGMLIFFFYKKCQFGPEI